MFRRLIVSTLSLFCITLLSAQQRPPTQVPTRQSTELVVKITYESGRAVADQVRVQLTNGYGIPVSEDFTHGEGEARFTNLDAGTYRLKVSGMDIEETASEHSFTINPRELTHIEYFQVRKKDNGQPTSVDGSVSAAALNIPAKAESEFDKGVNAMKKENLEEAQKRFERAAEIYPKYAMAFNNLGIIAMKKGNPEDGQALFSRAVQADDKFAPSYINLAKLRMGQKNYAEALQLLNKATAVDARNAEAFALLTVLEFESNQMPAALAHARKVHSLPAHERFAFAHFIAGRVLEAQSYPTDALAEYKLFLKEAPESPTSAKARASIDAIEKQKR